MVCAETTFTESLNTIRAEYLDMPGLVLTRRQFQRLWRLDGPTCAEVIDELVKSNFLVRRADGNYGRRSVAT